jgi:glycosyltransferase involved in cell wall biosynthesis
MSSDPTISVVMICYNHEKFIKQAINSILSQTFSNFELIIVDDGSTDNTVKIIGEYQDNRIILLEQQNSGPSIALNNGLDKSRGQFIALMSGDDVSLPDRLMTQMEQLVSHSADIVFNRPQIIDSHSNILDDNICPWFFEFTFNDTAELYSLLFHSGNFLCAPSCFCRRDATEKIGRFKRGLIQLQDFDYWIRACKQNLNIKISDDPVIQYRYLFGGNLSDERNMNRTAIELLTIYRGFFDGASIDLLHKSFSEDISLDVFERCSAIDVDITFLLLEHPKEIVQTIGIERLIIQLDDDQTYGLITTGKKYSTNRLFQLMLSTNINQIVSTSQFKKNLKHFRNLVLRIVRQLTAGYPEWTDSKVRERIEYYIAKGDIKRAILISYGYRRFPPGPTIFATFLLVWNKLLKIIRSFIIRIIRSVWSKIKRIITHISNFVNKASNIENVYTINRMYDYCKLSKGILYEDPQDSIYIKKPIVLGNYFGTLGEGEALSPHVYISVVKQAIISGGSSMVFTQQGFLLNDEMFDFYSNEFGTKSPYVSFRNRENAIASFKVTRNDQIKSGIIISCDHDFNYFHWLVECLPKLMLINNFPRYNDIPLIIPSGLHKNLLIALERVNNNIHPIITINPGYAYYVDELIYPSAISRVIDRYKGQADYDSDIILSPVWVPKVSNLLKQNVKNNKEPWRKVFLARRSGARVLGNQKEIELLLSINGFEIIDLENASLDYQIELFSQVSVIVAPTGAALTNMLLCKPGTKVIIFMSNHETTNFYFWSNLGNILGHDVKIIAGPRLFNLTNEYSVHDDYTIDPKLLLEVINSLGYK